MIINMGMLIMSEKQRCPKCEGAKCKSEGHYFKSCGFCAGHGEIEVYDAEKPKITEYSDEKYFVDLNGEVQNKYVKVTKPRGRPALNK